MAGFTVVSPNFNTAWFPVHYNSETLYVGQIVTLDSLTPDYGLKAYNPAGANDTTVDQCPLGIVIGFNNRVPTFNTTYKAEYGTSYQAQATQVAHDFFGVEGTMGRNDPALFAQVALLDSTTMVKGRIFHGSYGTACDTATNTTASSGGTTVTTTAIDYAGIAGATTMYCRTGGNAGLYRVGYDTSTTSHTPYLYFPYAIAANDVFVFAHMVQGVCKVNFDDYGTFIEQYGDSNSYGTDYLYVRILSLNLKDAGNEYAIFQFTPNNFFPVSRT
jgi:hypothetical protein